MAWVPVSVSICLIQSLETDDHLCMSSVSICVTSQCHSSCPLLTALQKSVPSMTCKVIQLKKKSRRDKCYVAQFISVCFLKADFLAKVCNKEIGGFRT